MKEFVVFTPGDTGKQKHANKKEAVTEMMVTEVFHMHSK